MKQQQTPYYTLTEVKELTGLSHTRIGELVRIGTLKKVLPPGNTKRGVYPRGPVDAFAKQVEAFRKGELVLA